MKRVGQYYGKQRIRVIDVLCHAALLERKERECRLRMMGDFAARFPAGDANRVVPAEEPHGQTETTFTRA